MYVIVVTEYEAFKPADASFTAQAQLCNCVVNTFFGGQILGTFRKKSNGIFVHAYCSRPPLLDVTSWVLLFIDSSSALYRSTNFSRMLMTSSAGR